MKHLIFQSRFVILLLGFLTIGISQAQAKEGDILAEVSGTGSGYGRQTTTDSHNVGWVTIGQSGYFGINKANNNTGAKAGVNAIDLPVAKAVDANATSSTSTSSNSCTGYYTFYTTTSLKNVGSIIFYYSANDGNSNATAYVVMGDAKSASGGAAYVQVPLAESSTSKQGVSLGTSGTFTFTFAETQTSAKYYGVVIATSSYKRMTGGKITIKEGASSSKTALDQVTNLSAGTLTATSATITWTGIADSDLDGYKVEYKKNSESTWTVAEAKTSSTSCTLSGLTPSTTYNYRVTSLAKSTSSTKKDSDPKAGTNFTTAAPASREIKWYANNQQVYAKTQQEGAALTIPSDPDATTYCYGKTFVGWTASQNYSDASTAPGDLFTSTDSKTVGSTTAYYAVFADAEGGDEFYIYHNNSGTKTYVGAISGDYLSAHTTKSNAVPYTIDSDGYLSYTVGSTTTYVTHTTSGETKVATGKTKKLTITKTETTIQLRSTVQTTRYLQYSTSGGGRFQFTASSATLSCESAISYSNYTTTCAPVYEATVADGITNGSVVISKTDDISTGVASLQGLKQGDKVYIFPTANKGYNIESVTVNGTPISAQSDKYSYEIETEGITVSATFAAKQTLKITATAPEGGTYTVKVDDQTPITIEETEQTIPAYNGAVITMTSTADDQHQLHSTPFVVKDADNGDVKVSKDGDNYSFTMLDKAVTVTAQYSATYSITAASCTGGSITKITDKNGKEITRTSSVSKVIVELSANNHYHIASVYYIKEGEEVHNDIAEKEGVYSFSMVASNITVYAEFEEDPTCTVQFLNNGTPIENLTRQVYTGETIGTIKGVETALPTLSSSDSKDAFSKTFVGWTTAKIEVWQDEAPTLVSASTTVTEALTLNAVWAKGGTDYEIINYDDELTSGNYVIAAYYSSKDYAMGNELNTQNKIEGTVISILDDDKVSNPDASIVWEIERDNENKVTFYNAAISKYLNIVKDGSYGKLALETTGKKYSFTVTDNGQYFNSWVFKSVDITGQQIENYQGTYTSYSSQSSKIYLYKQGLTDYITHSSSSPLESITLNTTGVKKNYFVGETFTSAHLSATAKLKDGIEFPIEYNDLTISTPDLTSAGETVTVEYTFNGATKSATYDVNAYSVTINSVYTDRVNDESVDGNTYNWNAQTHALTFTKQAHYKFNGIEVVGADKTGSNLSYTLSNPIANVTLTATWQRLFTLTYNGKGGSTTPAAVTDKTNGTEITLATPSRTGYDFVGWYDNESYEGDALTSPYTITADAEIFAKWSEIMPASISLSPDVTEITDLIYDDSNKNTKKITATVEPSTALVKTFEWSVVEGDDVVEVATDGTISALKAGSAKVKVASSRDANIYKEISVTVHSLPQITWLNMDGAQFGETTKGTSAGKVGALPTGTPTSCNETAYPYFRGWSATNFGKTTDNPEADFVTINTAVELDEEYTFYAVCAAGTSSISTVFTETFDQCAGSGGNDNKWSGNIATADINADNTGWTFASGGGGSRCAKFGASKSAGSAKTPSITMNGNGTIYLRAASFGTDGTTLFLSATSGTLGQTSISLTNSEFKDYEISISNVTNSTQITFSANSGKRFFIDNVVVKAGSISYTTWATQCCQAPEHELAITTTALTVKMGGTLQLSTGETGNGNTIKWESKNTAVATVDQSGLVTPFGTGKATITVSQEANTVENVDYCEQYAEVEVEVIANDEFGIAFTATEGGSAVAKINDAITQKATTGTTVTIVAAESSSDYIFDSWTVVSGGVSLTNTTDNPTTFEMGSANVEITPNFYKKVVNTIGVKTTPSKTTYTTRDHLNVTGLVITANYTKHGSEDIAYAGNEDKFSFSPALDANLTAGNQQDVTVTYDGKSTTFKIDVAQYTTPYYSLVTDASQLVAGKKVVFGTKEADKVMGYYVTDANNISGVDATYNEDRSGVEVEDAAYIVSGNAADGWHFADAQGRYIYVPEVTDKNYLYAATDKQGKGTWSVSIDEATSVLTMKCTGVGLFDRTLLSYNTNDPGFFSCYKTTQKAVYMYIEDVKPVYVPVTSIVLNETAMNVMQSKSGSLIATVGPDNATQHNVTWSIINDNANGKITVTEAGTVLVDEEAVVGATATVRATTDGTDKDGNHLTAECVITVTELETIDYMLVTTASLLQAGDIIVLGCTANNVLSGSNNGGDYVDGVVATYNEETKTMSSKYAIEITIDGNAVDGWTFTTQEGNYYISGSNLKVGDKTATTWSISIADNGNATIKNGSNQIKCNTNLGRFKIYTGESPIQIYSKRDTRYKRTGLTYDQAGTICLPYAVKADDYTGASVWSIESRTGTGTMISSITLVKEEGDLVAGKPYIFFAEEETFAIFCSGNPVDEVVEANGLIGNLDATPIIINQGQYQPGSYLINQNKLMECGTNCNVPQYRAYVKADDIQYVVQAPPAAPRRTIGNPSGTPTNLNGLNGNVKAQKALIDGHIYILRDNKMYNAQGLFVK